MSVFDTLNAMNVNERTEKKNGLTYLSWAWAWAEVKKKYPDATYTIYKNEYGLPYVCDTNTGYMVYTTVTIEGITHEMWLPVMDSVNHAMKTERYTITNKYGKETVVEAATMFDVNKAVMRCLTKNLAMFGLGLYIYAGEDLPEEDNKPSPQEEKEKKQSPQEEKEKKDLLYSMDFNIIKLASMREKAPDFIVEQLRKKVGFSGELKDLPLDGVYKVNQVLTNWLQLAEGKNDETASED